MVKVVSRMLRNFFFGEMLFDGSGSSGRMMGFIDLIEWEFRGLWGERIRFVGKWYVVVVVVGIEYIF